jgi:hypothetical protein
MWIDPSRLHNFPRITVRADVDIVLYSSTGGPLVSARAAMALRRIGADNVWVLEGGPKAWRERGSPYVSARNRLEVIADRLGIKLPKPPLLAGPGPMVLQWPGSGHKRTNFVKLIAMARPFAATASA